MPSAKHLLRIAPLCGLLLLPLCVGCLATYGEQQSQAEAALRADMRILQEDNQRLKGRIESYDLEIERLNHTVESLRAAPGGPSLADVQALQQRITALESQLRTLDQARERDRKEIIDTLSSKLSQIANSSRPAPRPAATGKRVSQQEGYEHVVEGGQTLSAIAAAYNVSTKSIIDANNLTKPDQLRVGQKLFIPAP
ncbi:MAG: LysM peptidoglycan-binding domain-containing protein [Kiritimatiellae bacterium]|nr:LysM peptidoglycan-binding domain-containing protein [Kiritimatiellia bacterium]